MGIAQRKGKSSQGGLAKRRAGHVSTQQRIKGTTRQDSECVNMSKEIRSIGLCARCGRTKADNPDLIFTDDHILGLADGGSHHATNRRCLCIDCHIKRIGKSHKRGAKMLKGLRRRLMKND